MRIKQTGRPKCTTVEQNEQLIEEITNNPFSKVVEVAQQQNFPYRTALRRIKQSGLDRRRASTRTFLNDRVRRERVKFAREMLKPENKANYNSIIFTDEKSFCSSESSVKYVYRPKGQRFNERFVTHSTRSGRVSASYFGWISSAGVGEIVPTRKPFNTDEYIKVLQECVVESVPVEFAPLNECIFQQDNARMHVSNKSLEYLNSLGFKKILDWPSNSPDANLIEHIWAIMEKKRENIRPANLVELDKMVHNVWESLRSDTQLIENLYGSLEKRFQYIVDTNGDWSV